MKLFVWDFHGVLEKGNEFAVQEVVNKVLKEFGINRTATIQECIDLYGKKWIEYYRYFAPEADEKTILKMIDTAVEMGRKDSIVRKYIKPMDYAHEVLKKIAEKGHMNIIMSNSSPESLDFFLSEVNMSNSFHHKFGADNHKENPHEKNSKEILLRNFLKEKLFEKIIVIDDFPEGIQMGKNIGAVTYQFAGKERNIKTNADFIISDLREVLKEI